MSISQPTNIGQLGNAIGVAQNAVNANYMFNQQAYSSQPQWSFNLVKTQNGFVLHFGPKSWICKDMEEVQQNFMVAMVEERIEK